MLSDFFSAKISVHVWVYYLTLAVMCADVIIRIIDVWITNKKEKRGKPNA